MKSKSIRVIALATLMATAAGGCANLNSISRTKSIPTASDGKVYTVDAKQRHLVMSRQKNGQLRVCAEAAPDVFSAFATSAAAQGDKSGGQFGLSSNETAATIERTQTINLLRESFYRTCERYLSGAIDENQFLIQASRDQKSMVAILAIEQLTGAYRPKSTIISPGGTASAVISGEKAAELIREHDGRVKEKVAAREKAQKAVDDAKDTVCKDEAQAAECNALKAELAQAVEEEEAARKALADIVALAKDLVEGSSAATSAGTTLQGGNIGATQWDALRMEKVANAVVKIVDSSMTNEPVMFCLGYLNEYGRLEASYNADIATNCMKLVMAQQAAETKNRLGVEFPFNAYNGVSVSPPDENELAYRAFITKLLRVMEETQVGNFEQKFKKFQSDTKSFGDPGYASDCTGKEAKTNCISKFKDRQTQPYRSVYGRNTQMFDSALASWDNSNK